MNTTWLRPLIVLVLVVTLIAVVSSTMSTGSTARVPAPQNAASPDDREPSERVPPSQRVTDPKSSSETRLGCELEGEVRVERPDLVSEVRLRVLGPSRAVLDELVLSPGTVSVTLSERDLTRCSLEFSADGHETVIVSVGDAVPPSIDVHLRRAFAYGGNVVGGSPATRPLAVFIENSAGRPLSIARAVEDDGRFEVRATTVNLQEGRLFTSARLVVHDGLSRVHVEALQQDGLAGRHTVTLPASTSCRVRFLRNGQPVVGARVERVVLPGRYAGAVDEAATRTDAEGSIQLNPEPDGRHFEGRVFVDDWIHFSLPGASAMGTSQIVDLEPISVRARCELLTGGVAENAHVQLTIDHGNGSWSSLRGRSDVDGRVEFWVVPGSPAALIELWDARTDGRDGEPPIEASGLAGWRLVDLPTEITLAIGDFREETPGTWIAVRGPDGAMTAPHGVVLSVVDDWATARRISVTRDGEDAAAAWLSDEALRAEGIATLAAFASDGSLCEGRLDTAALGEYTLEKPFVLESRATGTSGPRLRADPPTAGATYLATCHPLGTLRGSGLDITFEFEDGGPLPIHRLLLGQKYCVVVSKADGTSKGASRSFTVDAAQEEIRVDVGAAAEFHRRIRRQGGSDSALVARLVPRARSIGPVIRCTISDAELRGEQPAFLGGYDLEISALGGNRRARVAVAELDPDIVHLFIDDAGVSIR